MTLINEISIIQANLQHSRGASSVISKIFSSSETKIILIQEPWINKGIKGLNHPQGKILASTDIDNPRAAILIKKDLIFSPITNFISRDLVAIQVKADELDTELVIASAYFPGDDSSDPPPAKVRELITFCKQQKVELLLGCDANAHHTSWNSSNINKRGEHLYNYLMNHDLNVLNQGNEPTFVANGREEVLDLTICTHNLIPLLTNWHVSNEQSLSDHRHICFQLNKNILSLEAPCNPRRTNWALFSGLMETEARNFPVNFNTTQEIESASISIQDTLMYCYNLSTSKLPKHNNEPRWWNKDLERLRRLSRSLFNKRNDPYYKSLYNKSRNQYRYELRKAKSQSWKSFCGNVNCPIKATKIYKALSKAKSNGIGNLKNPDGNYTETKNQCIKLLLDTHFPDSSPSPNINLNTIAPISGRSEYYLMEKIFAPSKIIWSINSFQPFKSPGGDGIIPKMLQESLPHLTDTLTHIFKASFKLNYIPSLWRKVNVIFIPKPGKDPTDPKSFRPISLSSFLLKTMERLLDLHIRETIQNTLPLHNLQFAYQKGKSTELAVHHLVSRIENSLQNKEISLCAFMDIQGAFDNTGFGAIYNSLSNKNIDKHSINWILSMLIQRQISVTLGDTTKTVYAAKGCPQGGVLSPLLWSIVIDELLFNLNTQAYHTIGYADDVVITITGNHPDTICDLMERALSKTLNWCSSKGLAINPRKTVLIPFHKKRKLFLRPISLNTHLLNYSQEVTYLGIKLDQGLSWMPHLQNVIHRATRNLWALNSLVGKTWGLSPYNTFHLYKSVIRPAVTYGSLVWWTVTNTKAAQSLCNKLQLSALRLVTGSTRSCPQFALETILKINPLHIFVTQTAAQSAARLESAGNNLIKRSPYHGQILTNIDNYSLYTNCSDVITPTYNFTKNFNISIPRREDYLSTNLLSLQEAENWFTDGSKTEEGTGSGIFGPQTQISIGLDHHATVFQTEVLAIHICAEEILKKRTTGKIYNIFSDSQAALMALQKERCTSKIVSECKLLLNQVGHNNFINIIWIPGHSGHEGNEMADELARRGSSSPVQGPLPSLPLAWSESSAAIEKWVTTLTEDYHNSKVGLTQSRSLINPSLHSKLSLANRTNLKLFLGYLTGHHPTNYFLQKIGAVADATCRLCGEGPETTTHLLQRCWALARSRAQHFGKPQLTTNDIYTSKSNVITSFIRTIESRLLTYN